MAGENQQDQKTITGFNIIKVMPVYSDYNGMKAFEYATLVARLKDERTDILENDMLSLSDGCRWGVVMPTEKKGRYVTMFVRRMTSSADERHYCLSKKSLFGFGAVTGDFRIVV